MIVIACHHTGERDFIRPCLASIRKHMPHERVCVVDSASPDRSYMDGLDADVLDIGNRHYETGAWWAAYDAYPLEPFFYFLHDSTALFDDLAKHVKGPLTVPGFMRTYEGCDANHVHLIEVELKKTMYPLPTAFWMPVGAMFFARRWILERAEQMGLRYVMPTTKTGAQCAERIWGIALGYEGFTPEDCAWGRAELLSGQAWTPLRKYYGHRGNP